MDKKQMIKWLYSLMCAMEKVPEGSDPEDYEALVFFLYNEVDKTIKELKDE